MGLTMDNWNSNLDWVLSGADKRTVQSYNDALGGGATQRQALRAATGVEDIEALADANRQRFNKNCDEIEALWQKCEASGDFTAFQADVSKRFHDAFKEDGLI